MSDSARLDGEMAGRVAALDWSTTPLGPQQLWPQSLRTTVSIMLNTRFPMFLFWGPEGICLYNDAYRPSLGAQMHPQALGMRAEQLWSDIWHIIGPQIDAVMSRGEQTWFEDQLVPFERSGYFEEIYFTYSYSPVFDESGGVGGTLVVCTETTGQVIAQRRLTTLLGVANQQGDDVATTLSALHDVLAGNAVDLPFSALYRLAGPGEPAELVWTTGVAAGGPLAPRQVPITADSVAESGSESGSGLWSSPLAAVTTGAGRTRVSSDGLPPLPGGHWPEPGREVLVVPVVPGGADAPGYALITGLSPRKALDPAYSDFLDLLAAGMAAAIGRAESRDGERRRAEALAAIDRAKTAFFANVSHEFRTPLTLVLGPLEDLLLRHSPLPGGGPDPDAAQLAKAHRNATRLLRLVNTLLDIARLDADEYSAQPTPTDLPALTVELVSAFASAATDAGIDLRLDCPPWPAAAMVDRQMWEKVVLNLVSNAVKYTLRGRIDVQLRHDGTTAQLIVRDTGAGIAAADQPHLFERFYRAGDVRARSHEGTGIGLALVWELLRLHRGSIEVTSQLGHGSTFLVRLPAPLVDRQAAGVDPTDVAVALPGLEARIFADEAARWVGSLEPFTPEPDAPRPSPGSGTLLVVDDNPDMRTHLSRLLGRRWQVRTAADGLLALEAVRQEPPDLILTDVMMPGLDGLGLLRAIRADPATAHLPVILLSARAGQEAAVEGLDAGADDYLVKPFAATELISRVRTNLLAATARQERTRLAEAHAREADALTTLTRALNRAQTVADVQASAAHLAGYLGAESADLVLAAPAVPPGRPGRGSQPQPDAGARTSGAPTLVSLTGPDGAPLATLRLTWAAETHLDGARRAALEAAGDITGQALERAVRFDREREIARALQASLLPAQLPTLAGVQVAGHYAAATADAGVGGDWYDVIRLAGGQVALVIGDVAGHGLSAASAMGVLSHSLRAYLADGCSPAEALNRLNRLAHRDGDQPFATVCCAVVDPVAGRLRWTTAGHPQPILRTGDGTTLLSGGLGVPIGVEADTVYEEVQVPVSSGDTIVLYTDGLVERRDVGVVQDRLVAHIAAGPADVSGLVDHVAWAFLPDDRTDDVAVLALVLTGTD